jgi:hypothetical protein
MHNNFIWSKAAGGAGRRGVISHIRDKSRVQGPQGSSLHHQGRGRVIEDRRWARVKDRQAEQNGNRRRKKN